MVREKMDVVAELQSEGSNFQEVTAPLSSPHVIEKPLQKPVGLDPLFLEVWRLLQDEKVGTIGIYGMGGVGKTTLLKKINNKFLESRSHGVDIVICVVVSKTLNLQSVQETIRSRLQISDERWKNRIEDDEKAAEIHRVLKTRKFVLLLDDLWEPLELETVGIPPLNDGNSCSKIVFTTRSARVCGRMRPQKSIKVECLEEAEALSLFQAKVGEDTLNSHPDIPKLAEMVAKECKGLPLALIVIARGMSSAEAPEEWERKWQMLRKYQKIDSGMENDLYSVLAFSYDSLPDEATKSCFLYCSLFPEDYEIHSKRLIELWIGEGFLDEYDDIQEARNQGGEIIERLKHACLLEEGTSELPLYMEYLKMHDVIRDMALWLACEKGEKKNNFLVKDGVGLIRGQEVERWKDVQRISLWNNTSIEELRESPHLPNTETLLGHIKSFPSGFFTNMPCLKVLDLSSSYELRELPVEICNLVTLQYLNLSATRIKHLPAELKNLEILRCLVLDDMDSLESLPSQMMSCLSSLQFFSMKFWRSSVDNQVILLKELEQLEHINDISITLTSVLPIQILFKSRRLRRSITFLQLAGCRGVNQVKLSPYIEALRLEFCDELKDVEINFEREVVPSKFPRRQYFDHLLSVHIFSCTKLLKLNWLIHAPKLQSLHIAFCEMEKVIDDGRSEGSEIESGLSVFSRLIELHLFRLPKLKSIYGHALPFPSLRRISVMRCPRLKKLPFDSRISMGKKLEEIMGGQEWWDGLEWDDPTIMHNLTPYFQPL